MNTMKFLVHERFEFGGFCTWRSCLVHHGIARWLGGEFCEKLKFVVFEMWWLDWPPNVTKWIPLKSWCIEVLSSEGFAHGQLGRCTTAYLDGFVGSFVTVKFVIFEMWGLERTTNVPKWIPWKSWCMKVLSSEGFAHGQVGRCTTSQPDCFVGRFVKKWNSWFLRCEGWNGLQMPPNEYHEGVGARKFWVRWVLHMAKLVGAPR